MWPRRRRTEQPSIVEPDAVRKAEQAAARAEEDLRKVKRQRPEVDALTASFQRHMKKNHFDQRFKLEIRRRTTSP